MADVVLIVSRTEPRQYLVFKRLYADGGTDVVLDRRMGERRGSLGPRPVERRHIDRRYRDVTGELRSSGWALVRRLRNSITSDATRCVEPGCQEEGVVGLIGAWLCLTHFDIRFAAMKAARDRAS